MFFSGTLPCANVETVHATDEDQLSEISFDYLYVSSMSTHEQTYNSDNTYTVYLANYTNLLCYLNEPSYFEVPYLVTLEFDLPNAYIQRLDTVAFKPRSVTSDGSTSLSTASTWGTVEVRYNKSGGTTVTENYSDYETIGTSDGILCTLDSLSTTDTNVHFTVKFWFTNRVGQLGYGIRLEFEELSNSQNRPIIMTVKTDSEEVAQLKTIAKNTEDTASGISGILEFLPNMLDSIGDFFTNLIDTIVQKFSDLIDDITDLFSDLTTSLSGFFSNLTSAISGFFSSLKDKLSELFTNITSAISGFFANLIQNLVDLFDAITTAIEGFFQDLLDGIMSFFQWLLIPTVEDIREMVEDFDAFWGDSILTIPLEVFTRFQASLVAVDFDNVYNKTINIPRYYMQINGLNYKIWDNMNVNILPQGGHIDYLLTHDFSSSTYPYINGNSARYGLFCVFWIACLFNCIKALCNMLGIADFIFNPVTSDMIFDGWDTSGSYIDERYSGYDEDITDSWKGGYF